MSDEPVNAGQDAAVHAGSSEPKPRSSAPALLSWLWVLLCGAVAIVDMGPPGRDLPSDSREAFSTERAWAHLEHIASEPHPTGSPANDRVREYVVRVLDDLGYDIELQAARVTSEWYKRDFDIVNVIARRGGQGPAEGQGDPKTIMLAAHYDSVSEGPGAADDGAAVAALLEVARVLRTDEPRPLNDLMIVLTDAEEVGLLGAHALTSEARHIADVAAVLNFEARGTSGASVMFETVGDADWLVNIYARAAPKPQTTSLAAAVYRYMPNNTDLTLFGRAGLPGLNFAFIGSPENYHTAGDTIANLDPASLRHHGVQALAVARRLLRTDINNVSPRDPQVYFSLGRLAVIQYPQAWVKMFCVLLGVFVVAAIAQGVATGQMRIGMIGVGLIVVLLALAAACGAGHLAWLAVRGSVRQADGNLLALGFVLLAGGVSVTVFRVVGRWLRAGELGLAGLLWVALGAVALTLWVPGASYILMWPAACAAVAWGWLFQGYARKIADNDQDTPQHVASVRLVPGLVCNFWAVPVIVLMLPIVYMIHVALGPHMAFALSGSTVLVVCCLLPQLFGIGRAHCGKFAAAVTLAGVAALVVAGG